MEKYFESRTFKSSVLNNRNLLLEKLIQCFFNSFPHLLRLCLFEVFFLDIHNSFHTIGITLTLSPCQNFYNGIHCEITKLVMKFSCIIQVCKTLYTRACSSSFRKDISLNFCRPFHTLHLYCHESSCGHHIHKRFSPPQKKSCYFLQTFPFI